MPCFLKMVICQFLVVIQIIGSIFATKRRITVEQRDGSKYCL
uniref:Uncharacterized protein n=1 Tax=Myoviridae sp. ctFYw8 TaxID=2825069 RepID=A0A8S5PCI0_9CAUD|nr:MAG TPA: hypothetical protein [Myoviridae sp. ctFYw8]